MVLAVAVTGRMFVFVFCLCVLSAKWSRMARSTVSQVAYQPGGLSAMWPVSEVACQPGGPSARWPESQVVRWWKCSWPVSQVAREPGGQMAKVLLAGRRPGSQAARTLAGRQPESGTGRQAARQQAGGQAGKLSKVLCFCSESGPGTHAVRQDSCQNYCVFAVKVVLAGPGSCPQGSQPAGLLG